MGLNLQITTVSQVVSLQRHEIQAILDGSTDKMLTDMYLNTLHAYHRQSRAL